LGKFPIVWQARGAQAWLDFQVLPLRGNDKAEHPHSRDLSNLEVPHHGEKYFEVGVHEQLGI
jgi:hypothetical protein